MVLTTACLHLHPFFLFHFHLLHCLKKKTDPISAKLAIADKVIDVANKGVDFIEKADAFVQGRVDKYHEKFAEPPDDLISSAALEAAMKNLGGAKEIDFQELPGFQGLNEFQPPGWSLSSESDSGDEEPEGEKDQPMAYPAGVGFALMNGCFGRDYKPGDPCYADKRLSTICLDQLDAANFIGIS